MKTKKKRYNRLRQVRPCYVCGRKARHFLETKNPCLCLACSRMPMEWRDELRKKRKSRIDFEKYCRMFDKVKLTNKQIFNVLEPINLQQYCEIGGYPIVYYLSQDPICGKCIRGTLQKCCVGERESVLREIYFEGPPQACTECHAEIESAYGEVENESE